MRNMELERFEHYGRTVRIFHDEDGGSCDPREYGGLTTIIALHRRHNIGEPHEYRSEDFNGWDAMREQIEADNKGAIVLPLYMYEHSGMALRTTPFGCRWDSGQIGFVLATRAKILECWGWKRVTADRRAKLIGAMNAEVAEYSAWCNGEVYGYTVSEPEDPEVEADSCWGFIGMDYAIECAKEAATPMGAGVKA